MNLRDFLNAHAQLAFIDREPWMTDDEWSRFTADPVRFLRRATDETAERVWSLVEHRETA